MKEFDYVAKCRVLNKIAEGETTAVYLAEQLGAEGFAKTVAIKVLKKDSLRSERALRTFIDQAKLTADLLHQNIVQVYQFEKVKNLYFTVMEYIDGRNLKGLMARHKALDRSMPLDMGAFIISRICRGLDYAHRKTDKDGNPLGILHRDVSPANVLIDFGGFVKLSDFGALKAAVLDTPDEERVVMGGYTHMAPELLKLEETDARTDVFSVGLVLYEVLTGRGVFKAASRNEMIEKLTRYRVMDVRKVNLDVPADLAEIVMKAVQREPERRYRSAYEMCAALEHYMYHDRYGPTNEKLAQYLAEIYPVGTPPPRIEEDEDEGALEKSSSAWSRPDVAAQSAAAASTPAASSPAAGGPPPPQPSTPAASSPAAGGPSPSQPSTPAASSSAAAGMSPSQTGATGQALPQGAASGGRTASAVDEEAGLLGVLQEEAERVDQTFGRSGVLSWDVGSAPVVTCVEGPDAGKVCQMQGNTLAIGSSLSADLVILTTGAESRHALLTLTGDGELWLEDQGTKFGTFVDDQKIQRSQVGCGTRFQIGDSVFHVMRQEPGGK